MVAEEMRLNPHGKNVCCLEYDSHECNEGCGEEVVAERVKNDTFSRHMKGKDSGSLFKFEPLC